MTDETATLTEAEIRRLLRESVTVVKPGEVLILRAADGMTPQQVQEIHQHAARWLECNAPDIKALVVPPMEIAIIPAGSEAPRLGFLKDCRIDSFAISGKSVARITHLPTGVTAEGPWDEAVADLGRKLIGRGDITINDARAAMGLKPFEFLDGKPA